MQAIWLLAKNSSIKFRNFLAQHSSCIANTCILLLYLVYTDRQSNPKEQFNVLFTIKRYLFVDYHLYEM